MEILFIITAILIFVIFLALIVLVNAKRTKINAGDQKRFQKHWDAILKEVGVNPKGAILEADKLLDEALKLKGYSGSLGEKLKKSSPLFSDLNGTWSAHKLRNRLAHELNAKISSSQAQTALNQFKRALKDLGLKL